MCPNIVSAVTRFRQSPFELRDHTSLRKHQPVEDFKNAIICLTSASMAVVVLHADVPSALLQDRLSPCSCTPVQVAMVWSSTPTRRGSLLSRSFSSTTFLAESRTSIVACTPCCSRALSFLSSSAVYSFCRVRCLRFVSLRRIARSVSCGRFFV